MATATVTPTSATSTDRPKLTTKASETSVPITPTQTSFGCQHIKGLLQAARDKASEGYTRLVHSIRNEQNVSDRIYKIGEGLKSTDAPTYLCLQCPNVSRGRERHRKDHVFSVESTNGFIYCHECRDFVYDPTFEALRAAALSPTNGKKRKAGAASSSPAEGDKRLLANNATATPCAATGLRGLYNMGQTCFMSVILQALVHNPFIRTFYLGEGHKSAECPREACTSCALDDIFVEFFGQEKREGYGAVHMLQGCWKGGGGLAGYSQQDAHEYLGFILNSLHAANTSEEDDGEGDDDASNDAENGSSRRKRARQSSDSSCPCAIHRTFSGQLRSTVTCTTCHTATSTLDPFMDLSLDIRNSHRIITKKKKLALTNGTQTTKEVAPMDLAECLERFTAEETLGVSEEGKGGSGGGGWVCRKCGVERVAKKVLRLARLPPVVPVHMKRFRHEKGEGSKGKGEGGASSKVETRIRFPFQLDLGAYCTSGSSGSSAAGKEKGNGAAAKPKPTKSNAEPDDDAESDEEEADAGRSVDDQTDGQAHYFLSSVIVHKGKLDNGHYISYARQGHEWFRFDDSMVVQVEEREVLGAEAYMLFYVRSEL